MAETPMCTFHCCIRELSPLRSERHLSSLTKEHSMWKWWRVAQWGWRRNTGQWPKETPPGSHPKCQSQITLCCIQNDNFDYGGWTLCDFSRVVVFFRFLESSAVRLVLHASRQPVSVSCRCPSTGLHWCSISLCILCCLHVVVFTLLFVFFPLYYFGPVCNRSLAGCRCIYRTGSVRLANTWSAFITSVKTKLHVLID